MLHTRPCLQAPVGAICTRGEKLLQPWQELEQAAAAPAPADTPAGISELFFLYETYNINTTLSSPLRCCKLRSTAAEQS